METKKMKEDDAISKGREHGTMLEDRISELPDGIILQILSHLPTLIAIQMSLLSKRWRRMWTLVSALDFCYSRDVEHFRRRDENDTGAKRLYRFMDECLKHPYADTTITKFKLDMDCFGSSVFVDGWLWFPVNKSVKELDIQIGSRRSTYNLPHHILHLKSLTLLRLSGVALGLVSTVKLPSLKVLYLYDVHMDDQTLSNVVLGSPSLEKLDVNHCLGLVHLQVSNSSLKYLLLRPGRHSRSIQIEAVNLRSFQCGSRYSSNKCSLNLVRCHDIRNLTLHDASSGDQWLEELITQLPFLESLSLDNCYGIRHMRICNQNLRKFDFTSDRESNSLEVTIDTPNLVSFSYSGYSMFKISVNAPNLINAKIEVIDYGKNAYDNEWYANLIEFLSEFNGCKNVHILCWSKKALTVPDELRKILRPPLPDLKCLKVNAGGGKMFKKIIFRNSLLWIAPALDTLLVK